MEVFTNTVAVSFHNIYAHPINTLHYNIVNYIPIKQKKEKNKRLANIPDSRMFLCHTLSAGVEIWEGLIS